MGLKNTGVLHQSPGQFCVFAAGDTVAEDYTDFTGSNFTKFTLPRKKKVIDIWMREERGVRLHGECYR